MTLFTPTLSQPRRASPAALAPDGAPGPQEAHVDSARARLWLPAPAAVLLPGGDCGPVDGSLCPRPAVPCPQDPHRGRERPILLRGRYLQWRVVCVCVRALVLPQAELLHAWKLSLSFVFLILTLAVTSPCTPAVNGRSMRCAQ